MSNTLFGSDRIYPWVICPPNSRWLRAVRCFALEMIPADCSISVFAAEPTEVTQLLIGQQLAVVLWDVAPENLGMWCKSITQTAIEAPAVLQIAAVTDLLPREQAVLSELGIVSMIRHPEQLPKLSQMIRRYLSQTQTRSTNSNRRI